MKRAALHPNRRGGWPSPGFPAGALLVAFLAAGIAHGETIWGIEGIGRPLQGYDHAARGAGGTAIAEDGPFGMSLLNPAAIADAQIPQAHFGVTTQDRWIKVEGRGDSDRRFDARLTLARVVLPGPGPLRWALGYHDLTDASYRVEFTVNRDREDEYRRVLRGTGGVGEIVGTVAARMASDRLAIGVHLGRAGGTIREVVEDRYVGPNYLDTKNTLRTRVENGRTLGLGAQLTAVPGLVLGACWRSASEVDLTGIWTSTTDVSWEERATYELPASTGLGMSLRLRPRIRLAADWDHVAWAEGEFRARSSGGVSAGGFGSTRDTDRIGIGLTFLPAAREGKSAVLRRAVWRVGLFWEELPVLQQAASTGAPARAISEWALTAGVGVPIQIDRGFMDFLLEVGRSGDAGSAGIQETFVRLGLSATFGRFRTAF